MIFRWAQGYNGERAEFIDRNTVAFQCGNSIKFASEDGTQRVLPTPGSGIGAFAVHYINKVFAVADIGIAPKVFILQYPSYRLISELEGKLNIQVSTS